MLHRTVLRRATAAVALATCGFCLQLLTPLAGPQANIPSSPGKDKKVDFVTDIQPIFQTNCYKCHGPNAQLSGLRLDLKPQAMAGGSLGRDILPGNAAASP